MSELKKRLMTAIFLIGFVVIGTWLSTPFYFSLGTALIILLALDEWAKLTKLGLSKLFLLLLWVGLSVLALMLPEPILLGWTCLFWIGMFYPVLKYKESDSKPLWAKISILFMFMGFMVLYPFWIGLNAVYNLEHGKSLLLLLVLIVALQDTGAYFVGKRWGRRKLLPNVSPGKTWEGVAGGTALSLLAVILMIIFIPFIPISFILVALFTLTFSVLGDLFESFIKRTYGVKDSGTLLPGHGGLLDRIDSLTAAVPFFALGCLWIL